jgi:hypothetical protein
MIWSSNVICSRILYLGVNERGERGVNVRL